MRPVPELESSWSAPREPLAPGTMAFATSREGGVSRGAYRSFNLAQHCGDEIDHVARNRECLAARLGDGGEVAIQWLSQVHGNRVVYADPRSADETPDADAVWTDQRGLALAIMTADCVPVLLSSDTGRVIGAAHAGWRGLQNGVLGALIQQMPVAAVRLRAWIGPHISARQYEVGEDVWSHFDVSVCLSHADSGKRYLNLGAAARQQLVEIGLQQVEVCERCTFEDEQLYSWRQSTSQGEPDTGRMASIIMRL